MFEYRIQRAWEIYQPDFGLGRLALFICFYNTFLFFLSGVFFKQFVLLALVPVPICLVFFYYRRSIIKWGDHVLLIVNTAMLALPIMLNYILVGIFDGNFGILTRYDAFFEGIDLFLFKEPVAHWLYQRLGNLGGISQLLYDFCMVNYFLYYLLPILGGLKYYFYLPREYRYRIGRYFFSCVLYFNLNYLIYLTIPVAGPQFYIKDFWNYSLPFGPLGKVLYATIQNAQTTFIDCFPSGHTGISFLVMLWMFRIQSKTRFIFLIVFLSIVLATLLMRYHYVTDLFAGIIMALLCYALAFLFFPVKNEMTWKTKVN
jgi:membrane-associated phospholipid phosphatase